MGDRPSSLASVLLARGTPASPDGEAGERAEGDEILFAKGAANAAGFNPLYRTFDTRPAQQRDAAFDVSKGAAAPRRGLQPFQAAVVAFGCIALLLSVGLYFGARSHGPAVSHPASAPVPVMAPPPVAATPSVPEPTVAAMPESAPEPKAPAPEPPKLERPITGPGADLVERGSEMLGSGDIATARLFFERGVEAGNGHAALMLGRTFDPAYLDRAGVRGMRGDEHAAESWYRRALALGDPDAQLSLDKLAARRVLGGSAPN